MGRRESSIVATVATVAPCGCTSKNPCQIHKNGRQIIVARPETFNLYSENVVPLGQSFGEAELSTQTVNLLNFVHLNHSFCAFIPSRIGWSKAVDAAIVALIRAQQYRAGARKESALHNYFLSYGKAVSLVQSAFESQEQQLNDQMLLSVSILCLCDNAAGQNAQAALTHAKGVIAILRARPFLYGLSDLARSIIYGTTELTFTMPCALGELSPFDEEHWRDVQPSHAMTVSPDTVELRWTSFRILTRLPRLVLQVRKLRYPDGPVTPEDISTPIGLANIVRQLEVKSAESKALHQVRIVKSKEPTSRAIVPYCFVYSSIEDMAACVLYWQARLHVIEICLAIHRVCPVFLEDSEIEQFKKDRVRFATNIIMSWEWAHARPQFGIATVSPLLVVWGALMSEHTFRGVPVAEIRTWIMERLPYVTGIWSSRLKAEELNKACEVFAGGIREGFMVDCYSGDGDRWYAA